MITCQQGLEILRNQRQCRNHGEFEMYRIVFLNQRIVEEKKNKKKKNPLVYFALAIQSILDDDFSQGDEYIDKCKKLDPTRVMVGYAHTVFITRCKKIQSNNHRVDLIYGLSLAIAKNDLFEAERHLKILSSRGSSSRGEEARKYLDYLHEKRIHSISLIQKTWRKSCACRITRDKGELLGQCARLSYYIHGKNGKKMRYVKEMEDLVFSAHASNQDDTGELYKKCLGWLPKLSRARFHYGYGIHILGNPSIPFERARIEGSIHLNLAHIGDPTGETLKYGLVQFFLPLRHKESAAISLGLFFLEAFNLPSRGLRHLRDALSIDPTNLRTLTLFRHYSGRHPGPGPHPGVLMLSTPSTLLGIARRRRDLWDEVRSSRSRWNSVEAEAVRREAVEREAMAAHDYPSLARDRRRARMTRIKTVTEVR